MRNRVEFCSEMIHDLPFDFGNSTHVGMHRKHNEDSMGFFVVGGGYLCMVADGLGGHQKGEVASQMAIQAILDYFKKPFEPENIHQFIVEAILYANQMVYQHGQNEPISAGLGTTLAMALFLDNHAYIAHVGDSRVYRFHPQIGLQALTKDHSFVQELLNQGIINEQEAFYHPRKNEVTRAIGTHPTVTPELQIFTIQPEDTFVLVTDGICGYVQNAEIESVLRQNLSAQQIAEQLVQLSLNAGGLDNATVQVVKFSKEFQKEPKDLSSQTNSTETNPKAAEPSNEENNQETDVKVPRSDTQESPFRYQLFVAFSVLSLAVLFYTAFFILPKPHKPVQNIMNSDVQDTSTAIVKPDTISAKAQKQEQLLVSYTVQANDNLPKLAKIFNVSLDTFVSLNQLEPEQPLKQGQKLQIPVQTQYAVKKGDNLEKIASAFQVDKKAIKKLNPKIKKWEKLKIGQNIWIPLSEN